MPTPRRRALSFVPGLVLLGLTLLAGALTAPQGELEARQVACIGYCAHPTNAAKVFRWGVEAWRQEFEVGPFSEHWQSDRPRLIGQQNGMLTIRARPTTRSVTVWPDDQAAQYGRWEARVRAVEKTSEGERFSFTWELVPVDGDSCDGSGIVLANYTPDDAMVTGAVRTVPDREFSYARKRDLRPRAWHTYAVEVTPDHISWFVDTKVMRTERRPEALSGETFRPQFVIRGHQGVTMRTSWMQMDWVRYYTLDRPSAKSIEAPQMTGGTYADAC